MIADSVGCSPDQAEAAPGYRVSRRALLGAGLRLSLVSGALASGLPPETLTTFREEWAQFRGRFVTAEGMVLDDRNGVVSHTEGVGLAMLFAAEAGDAVSFERIIGWARQSLRRRDHLFNWRYIPGAVEPVPDRNNATDGDILIAWALQRAASIFQRPEWREEARLTAREILRQCVMPLGRRLVLLPGMHGFIHRDRVVVNPSYYIWPALRDFERLVPGPQWRRLIADGHELCSGEALFGRWRLPPDWLELSTGAEPLPRPASDRPARFSWDAIRIPLYLVWGGMRSRPALVNAAGYWGAFPMHRPPAWVHLPTNGLAPYPGNPGVQAVAALVRAAHSGQDIAPVLPQVARATGYYDAALILMCRLAWQEGMVEPVTTPLSDATPAALRHQA
jgi:endoglucanase